MAINSGRHRGSQVENFLKRKEAMNSQIENFKSQNPTLFENVNIPAYQGDEVPEEPTSTEPIQATHINYGMPSMKEAYMKDRPVQSIYDVIAPNLREVSPGDAPVYDEAKKKELQKQARLAALAQGLQSVFGAVTLARGGDIPNLSQNAIGADAIARMGQLDENYYNQFAQYRDHHLKSQLFNAGAQNEAAMQTARALQDRIATEQNQNFNKDILKSKQDFEAAEAALDRKLKEVAYDIEKTKNFNYSQSNKLQTAEAFDDAIQKAQSMLEILQDNFSPQNQIDDQMRKIRDLEMRRDAILTQLGGKEGFNVPNKPTYNSVDEFRDKFRGMMGGKAESQSEKKPSVDPKQITASAQEFSNMLSEVQKTGKFGEKEYNSMINSIMRMGKSEEEARAFVDYKLGDLNPFGE